MPSSRSSGQRENRITTAVLLVAIAVVGILIVLPQALDQFERCVLELYGDKLASVAQDEARKLDPERKGLHISVIEAAVLASGHTIRGDDRVTLGSALNGAHHRFDRVGTGTWVWKETESIEGLTASALLDEAYLTAKRIDPERHGVHYEVLKDAIVADGARIAGGRPGNTLFTVLKGAKQWFEALGDGFFRWR